MSFTIQDLAPLAGVLVEKGLPAIAEMLGGPIAGSVASLVVPQIAQAFGLPADAPPAQVAAAVQADPNADSKLATFSEQNKLVLAMMQIQADQNRDELNVDGPPWMKFFYGGWRPAMGWTSGPGILVYQIVAFATGVAPLPDSLVNSFLFTWASIAGLRTYERATGVSLDSILTKKK